MEKKKAGRKSKRPSREQFEALYTDYSAPELAARFNVSVGTIYQWANKFRKEEKENEESDICK